jgi:hypothetical protein
MWHSQVRIRPHFYFLHVLPYIFEDPKDQKRLHVRALNCNATLPGSNPTFFFSLHVLPNIFEGPRLEKRLNVSALNCNVPLIGSYPTPFFFLSPCSLKNFRRSEGLLLLQLTVMRHSQVRVRSPSTR